MLPNIPAAVVKTARSDKDRSRRAAGHPKAEQVRMGRQAEENGVTDVLILQPARMPG
jgi:hypothetical protein